MNKLLPCQTCTGFCRDILPTAGHQSSRCFCGCFLEYVFSTPWASAILVTSSGLLATALGLQEITATHSGCGLLVSRDKLFSCYSWLQPQTAMVALGTPREVLFSEAHMVSPDSKPGWWRGLQAPFLPTASEKSKPNKSAVDRLQEPIVRWFLRNCPAIGLSFQVKEWQTSSKDEGEKALSEEKKIKE